MPSTCSSVCIATFFNITFFILQDRRIYDDGDQKNLKVNLGCLITKICFKLIIFNINTVDIVYTLFIYKTLISSFFLLRADKTNSTSLPRSSLPYSQGSEGTPGAPPVTQVPCSRSCRKAPRGILSISRGDSSTRGHPVPVFCNLHSKESHRATEWSGC